MQSAYRFSPSISIFYIIKLQTFDVTSIIVLLLEFYILHLSPKLYFRHKLSNLGTGIVFRKNKSLLFWLMLSPVIILVGSGLIEFSLCK